MRIGEFSFIFLSTGVVLVVDANGLSLVLPSVILLSPAVVLFIAIFALCLPLLGCDFDNIAFYGHNIHKGCNTWTLPLLVTFIPVLSNTMTISFVSYSFVDFDIKLIDTSVYCTAVWNWRYLEQLLVICMCPYYTFRLSTG
jgi:hypothetical protein